MGFVVMNKLQKQLMRDEGFVSYVYTDSLGYLTLGIGRMVDSRRGGGISEDEAMYLLNNDIANRVEALRLAIPWINDLDEARTGVLINMAFQMGVNGLLGFKNALACVEIGDYDGAAAGMLNSLWARQTPERAARLAKQMKIGEWQ